MGQTILGGALTSILSGVFLCICQVAVLNKFGLLFISTIVGAFLTSVIFLPSMLYCMGPNGNTGSFCVNKEKADKKNEQNN
tara:strand:+ start:666 stop:908 length:243 start_codon:yes stop_codon:yes gene_type:complete